MSVWGPTAGPLCVWKRVAPLLVAPLGLLWPSAAWGVEVELKPGDDVRTLTATLQAGDVFTFSGGLYELTDGLEWTGLGTEEAPITLRAKSGETPVLQLPEGYWLAYIHDAAYLRVEGLTFTGGPPAEEGAEPSLTFGIYLEDSSHVTLDTIEIYNTYRQSIVVAGLGEGFTLRRAKLHDVTEADALYVACGDAGCPSLGVVENNWIYGIRGGGSEGIELTNGVAGFTVVDNVIYNGEGGGIATRATNFGEPNVVERNVMWSLAGRGLELDGGVVARNNILFNIPGYGIVSEPSDAASAGAVVISHNTVVNIGEAAIYVRNWAGVEGMVLANNAFTNVTGVAMDVRVDEFNYVSGNVATGLVEEIEDGFSGGYGLSDYVDPENWDFWPSEASALLDVGDATAEAWVPATDFNGLSRPGDRPDVGALERSGPENPGWEIREGFKEPTTDGNQPGVEDVEGGCGCAGDGDATPAALGLGLGLIAVGRRRRR